MAEAIKPKFTFESSALDKNTFNVVKFKGSEGLSKLYHFDVTLISTEANVDLDSVLQNPAVFTIKRDDGDIPFHGILSSFEQLQQAGTVVFYRATLVPKLWWTTLTHHNQIFLNKNAQGFLSDVLNDGGLKQGLNYDFKLQGSYPTWEYICQYDESHFNFTSRWMERDGMYYYFEQSDQGEKMVVTDTHISHMPMPEGTKLSYSPPSNLDHASREEVVKNFILKQQPMPKKVLLKDYNYRKPSLELQAEAVVSPKGMGEIYIYGEHFQTPGDGEKLAKVRAEEFLCREKVFHGVSTVPYVRTGYVFELADHYRNDFNQRYLTTEVTHEGSQEAYLVSGLGLHLAKDQDKLYYRNSFSCIPANTQFRAERSAEKPKFHGSMNAKIDASGSGQYAELDSEGRYKVVLPLDVSGRSSGKATTWLRMAQPYGGSSHGMHFPLHKGTEVLLTCIDGDPDRPIIQAAVPNPETPSQVNEANQTQCKITTAGQNKIHMEDNSGGERILMQSPKENTWIRMGQPNDPPSAAEESGSAGEWKNEDGEAGFKLNTNGALGIMVGWEDSMILGSKTETVMGLKQDFFFGNAFGITGPNKTEVTLGMVTDLVLAKKFEFAPDVTDLTGEEEKLKGTIEELTAAKTKMEGELTHLKGEQSDMVATVTYMEGEKQQLAGEVAALRGSVEKLDGTVETLRGEHSDLVATVTHIEAEKNIIAGAVTEVLGEMDGIHGAIEKVEGDVTKVQGAVTKLEAEKTIIGNAVLEMRGIKSMM